jgi:hypothetical protein
MSMNAMSNLSQRRRPSRWLTAQRSIPPRKHLREGESVFANAGATQKKAKAERRVPILDSDGSLNAGRSSREGLIGHYQAQAVRALRLPWEEELLRRSTRRNHHRMVNGQATLFRLIFTDGIPRSAVSPLGFIVTLTALRSTQRLL